MEQKNNAGTLFKNSKKDKPTSPDYTGTAVIADKKYRISGWVNKSKNGLNYLRIIFGEVPEADLNPSAAQIKAPMQGTASNEETLDDLPF